MTIWRRSTILAAMGFLMAAATAWAQPQRATGVTVGAGVSDDSSATGPAVGGSFLIDLTPSIGVEGAGRWLSVGEDASAFAADLTGTFGLRTSEQVLPYAAVGVGLYRASFDLPAGAGPPANVPGFYRRRLPTMALGAGGRQVSFTDPTLVLGAGVTLTPQRRWLVRPDVRMLFVRRDGSTHNVLVATVNVGVRFENRPVTP